MSDVTKSDVETLFGTKSPGESTKMSEEDFEECKRTVESTRLANAQLLHELSEIGFRPEFTVSMLAIYFHGLVEVGVLSEQQLAVIERNWEQMFHRQLQMMLKNSKAAVEQAQTRAQLMVPPSAMPPTMNRAQRRAGAKQGLILPGE